MTRMLLTAAAALALAAAAQAQTAPAAKPAPKTAAKAPPAGAFDARDPAALVSVLAGLNAKAGPPRRQEDAVFLAVTSPAYAFTVQFAGCDAQGRRCQAMAFETRSEQRTATLAELNGFNQSSLACKVWQGRDGRPHVMYSAMLSARDDREITLRHVGAWQGCLASFGEFLADPAAYLASAP